MRSTHLVLVRSVGVQTGEDPGSFRRYDEGLVEDNKEDMLFREPRAVFITIRAPPPPPPLMTTIHRNKKYL